MKQGKKRAYREIQTVENSGNFCKVVPVPLKIGIDTTTKKQGSRNVVPVSHLLVPVPIKEKVAVAKWY